MAPMTRLENFGHVIANKEFVGVKRPTGYIDLIFFPLRLLGPVVQKPISVNPGLKISNPGLNFKPRLICLHKAGLVLTVG